VAGKLLVGADPHDHGAVHVLFLDAFALVRSRSVAGSTTKRRHPEYRTDGQ
jgi:hypothetical protein